MNEFAGHRRFLLRLTALYGFVWIALAIDPHYRADWLIENVLVGLFALGMIASYRYFPFSKVSLTLIFVFMCLHAIGSHYTYAEVPYDLWWQRVFGYSLDEALGFERNHFDRLVHFAYGLLLVYPIREIFLRIADMRGFWGYFLPLDLTMSTSMIYELIEWAAAMVFGGELGMAYLGTQGDVWDAHRDMALATLGGLIGMLITLAINAAMQRDFAREWSASLAVKRRRPLGEVALDEMLNDRR